MTDYALKEGDDRLCFKEFENKAKMGYFMPILGVVALGTSPAQPRPTPVDSTTARLSSSKTIK
jgi:hypothetical protein